MALVEQSARRNKQDGGEFILIIVWAIGLTSCFVYRYVWFDALTNYLTGTGWPEKPTGDGMWPASVHIIGKDIIWFHCVIWPCMLWSAGLPLPAAVFGHGFVTAADGQKMSKANGDIYLDTYEGWYNVREETFVTETDAAAANYLDPVSGKPLKKMKEESYFFRQSRYHAKLIEHIERNPSFIQPTRRRNEILARLREDELRDLSVSRTTFDWGIPVPDAPGHVM